MSARSVIKSALRRILRQQTYDALKNHEFRLRLLVGAHYEREVRIVRSLLPRDAVVIDVGANIGQYTVPLAKRVGPHGKVISLEPSPSVRALLTSNVQFYRLRNVEVLPFAASDGEPEVTLFTPVRQSKASFQESAIAPVSTSDMAVSVRAITLDSLPLDRCDLIKIDTEGAELKVLKGATRVLERHRPLLLLEVDPRYCSRFGYTPRDLVAFLGQLGYHAGVQIGGGLRRADEPKDLTSGRNIFFLHSSRRT